MPDYQSWKVRTTEVRPVIKNIPTVINSGQLVRRYVRNPLSPDLNLTGQEYAQDKKIATVVLNTARRNDIEIKSVAAVGLVSDDFGGKLGQRDPGQNVLALARANVAAQAFRDVAQEKHFSLDLNIHASGYEAVLNHQQLKQLAQISSELGQSRKSLLIKYNSGKLLPAKAESFFDKNFGANRGVEYRVQGIEKIKRYVKKTALKSVNSNGLANDLPGEVIFGFPAAMVAFMGMIFSYLPRYGRYTRRRATKIARKNNLPV